MLKHSASEGSVPKVVVTIAGLEEYAEKIGELRNAFPERWHLIWSAEDKCRRGHFERLRRSLLSAQMEGRLPMNLTFTPDQPWNGVFVQAARDSEYWDRYVVRPAQAYIARTGAKRTLSKLAHSDGLDAVRKDAAPGEGVSRNAKRRRREKERAQAAAAALTNK